jgi:hypothetical protein
VRGGQTTQVAYAGFKADRSALKAYLDSLSAVSPATFGGWTKAERQAFLINAYNAFTIELILTRYPDLKSITTSVHRPQSQAAATESKPLSK